jgi:hypothetical protein
MGALAMHLVQYPLETLQSLLPYSVLLVFTLRRGFLREIFSIPLLKFSFLMFFANYFVYLISPGANQRYIYMLYPFAMVILSYACFKYANRDTKRKAVLGLIAMPALVLLLITGSLLPFLEISQPVPYVWLVSVSVVAASLILLYLFARKKEPALLFYLIALITLRLTLDTVYLPLQAVGSLTEKVTSAARIVEITEGEELFSYGELNHGLIFYLERKRGEILRMGKPSNETAYVIAKDSDLAGMETTDYYAFNLKGDGYRLVRFKPEREVLTSTSLLHE